MIKRIKSGFYKLIETKKNIKILYLDNRAFAWIEPSIGELLVVTRRAHHTDCILSIGKYYTYSVADEPALTDLLHLELEVGERVWQGYLLPTGLPEDNKPRVRVIPTNETITGNPKHKPV